MEEIFKAWLEIDGYIITPSSTQVSRSHTQTSLGFASGSGELEAVFLGHHFKVNRNVERLTILEITPTGTLGKLNDVTGATNFQVKTEGAIAWVSTDDSVSLVNIVSKITGDSQLAIQSDGYVSTSSNLRGRKITVRCNVIYEEEAVVLPEIIESLTLHMIGKQGNKFSYSRVLAKPESTNAEQAYPKSLVLVNLEEPTIEEMFEAEFSIDEEESAQSLPEIQKEELQSYRILELSSGSYVVAHAPSFLSCMKLKPHLKKLRDDLEKQKLTVWPPEHLDPEHGDFVYEVVYKKVWRTISTINNQLKEPLPLSELDPIDRHKFFIASDPVPYWDDPSVQIPGPSWLEQLCGIIYPKPGDPAVPPPKLTSGDIDADIIASLVVNFPETGMVLADTFWLPFLVSTIKQAGNLTKEHSKDKKEKKRRTYLNGAKISRFFESFLTYKAQIVEWLQNKSVKIPSDF